MDEQRCSAPRILQSLSSPSPAWESLSTHKPTKVAHPRLARRSASLTNISTKDIGPVEQENFLAMVKHAQRGRMDDQRCTLEPIVTTVSTPNDTPSVLLDEEFDWFFNMLENTQCRRIDDQRATLPSLPVTRFTGHQDEGCKSEAPFLPPQITLTEGTPVAQRKTISRPASPTRSGLESAAIQRHHPAQQYPAAQVTLTMSINFTPQKGWDSGNQPPCSFPDMVLTLGPPGEALVVPLTRIPGKPLSLHFNLVPREDFVSGPPTPHLASPIQPHTRPSSPNPSGRSKEPPSRTSILTPDVGSKEPSSPNPSGVSKEPQSRPSSPNPSGVSKEPQSRPSSPNPSGVSKEPQSRPSSPNPSGVSKEPRPRPSSLYPGEGSKGRCSKPISPGGKPKKELYLRPLPPSKTPQKHRSPSRTPPVSSPISPDEDYFSLIQRVHTAQIQKGLGIGGEVGRGHPRKEGGRADPGKGQGKGDGVKDSKDRGRRK
ncbi:hypothetical protein UPYG_G00095960 [Umbra pygmaea]|uniref:Uncharacterized protein n=1 Tax=Umbra pygmaea TaxID=75934 RepID=A0ABD0WZV2_UMBPY